MQNRNKTIGIIVAMQLEAEGILSHMTEVKERRISGVTFFSGKLREIECVTAVCGIGKVFAALCAQTMILAYSPDLIINTGVAGSLSEKLSIGDIAIAERLVQHDMDTSALGDPVGMISGINKVYLPCSEKYSALLAQTASTLPGIRCQCGTIASGDKFMADQGGKERVVSLFGAIACEMEGAAIGQVCYVNDVPCCVMRAISDGGDEEAAMDYPTFAKMAAERAVCVIDRFFARLSEV